MRGDTADGRAQILTLRASGRRLVPKLATLLALVRRLAQTLGLRGAPVD